MSTMIFLGAGASAADGAPIQGAVFRDYARQYQKGAYVKLGATAWSHVEAIPSFLKGFFGIDLRRDDIDSVTFPTFEEALGILELARARREGFGQFSFRLGTRPANSPTIDQMRFILIELLTLVIAAASSDAAPRVHQLLCEQLNAIKLLDSTTFVTTNYDTFIDTALTRTLQGSAPEYGFTLDSFTQPAAKSPHSALLKVHGSLDWQYCPSCLSVRRAALNTVLPSPCVRCGDWEEALIVPPTFFKEMDNVVLGLVWRQFQVRLQDTDHLIFCGYSFPDADMHIKYAIKHREVIGRKKPLRITVLNDHPGKSDAAREDERARYARFFSDEVRYTDSGFEDFAKDPAAFLSPTNGTAAS